MFDRRISLGRIRDVPIGLHWSVVVMFGLIAYVLGTTVLPTVAPERPPVAYWLVAVAAATAFLASLLAHELAHAVIATRHGIRVRRITLWLLGGVAELEQDPTDPRADLRIAIAGPLASIAISLTGFAVALVVSPIGDALVVGAIVWLALINLIIGIFNLLPGAPLDGGRVLRAFLWRTSGNREQAARRAASAGRGVGLGLVLLGAVQLLAGFVGGVWLMLIGWFLVVAASAEQANAVTRERLVGLRIAEVLSRRLIVANSWWTAQQFIDETAAKSASRVFPVIGVDGSLAGTVSLSELARIMPESRSSVVISDVLTPIEQCTIAHPDDLISETLSRTPMRAGRDLILVCDGTEFVGIVEAEDIARALERRALGLEPRTSQSL